MRSSPSKPRKMSESYRVNGDTIVNGNYHQPEKRIVCDSRLKVFTLVVLCVQYKLSGMAV